MHVHPRDQLSEFLVDVGARSSSQWMAGPPEELSILRFRLGRFDLTHAEDVVWTLRAGTDAPTIARGRLPASLRRWRRGEVPLPPGTATIELEASSPSAAATSFALGAPALLVPRSRIPSVVLFEIGTSDRASDLASFGHERLRILLQLGDAPTDLTASFDESYSSTSELDFSRRLLALAPDLYRISSLLLVKVGGGAATTEAEGDFGRRQLALLRAELNRLGLTDEDVEVRVFDAR